ncbi:hypothetical protein DSM03_102442 [Leeuwenhoekiella aestuarii]|uniref:Damage-inducible protein DinB n=1 Tax=Leeuwenhoekiella aestuarii TaxID=2249426 RepID=A0A4Q0NUX8_9FLAO|nr:DUF1572 domain-containing protein [Leeuwenhoekiella aestuarii]RXG15328.1 hypothetical protein DSM04_103216 [Leeuwenhoekiella aestuarii]RXG17565.1 hypothetical protein DSM03_102442 [Leeuwenhoekiella aestuarii]
MSKSRELSNRLQEVIIDGTWIANTNFKNQLETLSFKVVTQKIKNYNTVADLAQHIHYYINGIKQVFNGGKLTIQDRYSFDFPPIKTQKDWDFFLNRFWKDTSELCELITQLSDEKLNAVFVKQEYGTYARNIEALIEHSYYHLGQITLLLKKE